MNMESSERSSQATREDRNAISDLERRRLSSIEQQITELQAQIAVLEQEAGPLRAKKALAEGVLEHVPRESYKVEVANYGKLVNDHGVVPSGGGYDLTLNSKGISPSNALKIMTTDGLFGQGEFRDFFPNYISESARATGALIIVNRGQQGVAFVRMRFRSETGEERAGRSYRQATLNLVQAEAWDRSASQFADYLADFRTNPEPLSRKRDERHNIEPNEIELESHNVYKREVLDQKAQAVADAITRMADSAIVLPPGTFSDEKDFLQALGRAVETLSRTGTPEEKTKLQALRVTSGIKQLKGPWLQYNTG